GDARGARALMSFDAPVVLALAPLLGGAVWFGAAWARRARVRRAALWSQETVRAALAAGRLGPTALSISAFLGVVALAGPRWGEENIVAETRGLSLALAIDISRSMLAEDVSPNRLSRAVRDARRVVVGFTDGEAHDTVPDIVAQAERLRALGVHLILVAEGTRTPTRIPVRDERGALQSWQRDDAGSVIQTQRRDDVLGAVADAAQ